MFAILDKNFLAKQNANVSLLDLDNLLTIFNLCKVSILVFIKQSFHININ